MGETKVDPSQLDEAAITDIKTDGGSIQPDTKHIDFQSPLGAEVDGDGVSVSIGSIGGLPGEAADAQTPKTHSNTVHSPAMLENAANKFPAYDGKTSPHDDDLLLLEDSENSYVKKKLAIASLLSGGGIFTEWHYEADEDEDYKTGDFGQKVRLTVTPDTAGTYLILGFCELLNTSANGETVARIEQDDTDELMRWAYEPEDTGADFYNGCMGFAVVSLTAAAHTFDLDYKEEGNGTAYIRKARIIAVRVNTGG